MLFGKDFKQFIRHPLPPPPGLARIHSKS